MLSSISGPSEWLVSLKLGFHGYFCGHLSRIKLDNAHICITIPQKPRVLDPQKWGDS